MGGRLVHGVLFMETTVMEQWLLHLTETPPTFRVRYMTMKQKNTGGRGLFNCSFRESGSVVSRAPELRPETAGSARQFVVYFLRFAAICIPTVWALLLCTNLSVHAKLLSFAAGKFATILKI